MPSQFSLLESQLFEYLELEENYWFADKEEKRQTFRAELTAALTAADNPSEGLLTPEQRTYLRGLFFGVEESTHPQARELLVQALRMNPNLARAWEKLGELYYQEGKLCSAFDAFERGTEFCGENGLFCRNMSLVLKNARQKGGTGDCLAGGNRGFRFVGFLGGGADAAPKVGVLVLLLVLFV